MMAEFLLENILNFVGFAVGIVIGILAIIGYRNTGSPTLYRLAIAFVSIGAGFGVIWTGYMAEEIIIKQGHIERWVETLGIALQTVGYFFIAFSHSIKAFFPRARQLRSIAILPIFTLSLIHIEHLLRATSFILLVYGAIETMLSYAATKKKGAASVASGLAMLALGEFLGWYALLFPDSAPLYYLSIGTKIAGLLLLFLPISRVPMTRIKLDGDI